MRKPIILAVIIATTAWLLWPAGDHAEPDDRGAQVLLDRVWIDRMPESPVDKFHVLVMLSDPQGGSFLHTSAFEGDFSVFEWKNLQRGRMDITMLQTGDTHRLRARVSDRNCRGFDYCMKLSGAPRGAERYFSMKEWIIESGVEPGRIHALIRDR